MGRPVLLSQLIRAQAPGFVVAAHVRVYEFLAAWTKTVGRSQVYETTIAQYTRLHNFRRIDRVRLADPRTLVATPIAAESSNAITVNQVVSQPLTSRASVALVDANAGSFFHDTAAGVLYISTPTGQTPAGKSVAAGFLLKVYSGMPDAGAGLVDDDGDPQWPYLGGVPNISRKLNSPLSGVLRQGGGVLKLVGSTSNLDAAFGRYDWGNGEVSVFLGGDDLPWSEYREYPIGKTVSASWGENEVSVQVADSSQDLLIRWPRTLFTAADRDTVHTFYPGGNVEAVPTVTRSASQVEASGDEQHIAVGQPKPVAYGVDIPNVRPAAVGVHPTGIEGVWCASHHPSYKIRSVTCGAEVVLARDNGEGGLFKWWATADYSHIYVASLSVDFDVSDPRITISGKMDTNGEPIRNFADVVRDIVEVECELELELDATILARSHFLGNLYPPRMYVDTQRQLILDLGAIQLSTFSYIYITDEGKLAYNVWHPSVENEFILDEGWGDFIEHNVMKDSTQVYQTVFVEYGRDPLRSGNEYAKVTCSRSEAAAVVLDRTATKTIPATLIADEAGAFVLGSRIARFCAKAAQAIPITTKMRPATKDVMSKFTATKVRQPNAPGHKLHAAAVGVSRDLTRFTCAFDLDDQKIIGTQAFVSDEDVEYSSMTQDEKDTMGIWTDDAGFADPVYTESFGIDRWF